LDWSLRPQGNVDLGVRLAVALEWFWIILSHFREGHVWLQHALNLSRQLELAAPLRAKGLCVAGTMMVFWNDYTRALPLLEESLELAGGLGDGTVVAEALLQLGKIARERGDYERAEALQAEVLALRQDEGNPGGIAQALLHLGDLALDQGDLARATERYEAALVLSRNAGYALWQGFALRALGYIECLREDYVHAQVFLEESRAMFQALGTSAAVGEVVLDLARLAQAQGDEMGAARQFAESLVLVREFRGGNKRDIAYCLDGLAGITAVQGQLARAARLFGAAGALRESAGIVVPPIHRGAYERDVARLRAKMDEASFAAAWDAGRAMTMEQVIAYALEDSTR
jgi:tetratricopeptide (TPR) repeat protein